MNVKLFVISNVKFAERVETREGHFQRDRRQEARRAEEYFQVQRRTHRRARVHSANGKKHHSHQVAREKILGKMQEEEQSNEYSLDLSIKINKFI